MMKPLYDQIIYGASFSGVLHATAQASTSRSILLLHPYGFPGGSITESLSCLQVYETVPADSRTFEITSASRFRASSLLSRSSHDVLLNPETLKYRLQLELENSRADLLFHVIPRSVNLEKNGRITITLIGKEGTTEVAGESCIDASEDYGLAVLLGRERTTQMRRLNVFITPPQDDDVLSHVTIADAVRLDDGRYWVSLENDEPDELLAEQAAQEVLEQFRLSVERSGSRLQVVPLRSEVSFSLAKDPHASSQCPTLDELMGRSFAPSEQVIRASYLERLSVR